MTHHLFSLFKKFIAASLIAAFVHISTAQADINFDAAVTALNAESYSEKIDAVTALGETGEKRVITILEAFQNGDLYVRKDDGKIVIALKQGDTYLLSEATSGAELGQAPKSALDKIRINNKLRQVIAGVLGGLTLLSPDIDQRQSAIDAVLNSKDASILPTLSKAIEREENSALKDRMRLAKAAIELATSSDETTVLNALITLEATPTPDVRSIVSSYVAKAPEGALKETALQTLDRIESSLALWEHVGDLYRGLSLGSVLLLAAVGLAITFGVMGVINMAHGEMVMIGAYATYCVQEVFRDLFPAYFDLSILVAIPVAFLVSGSFGVVLERTIIRFLYGRPLETLLATWGVSLMLQQLVRSIFGPTNRDVGAPSWMSGAIEFSNGLALTYSRLWIIAFAILVVAGVALVLRKTAFGLQMRAVTQNRAMAASMGIRTGWVDAMTFGLGSGIAGMAGVALSQIDNVSPNLGQAYIIDSFMVVVFGGVGNIMGTVVGAFSLGIVNKFMEPMAGAVLAKILILIALILFIQKRPRGLFALKGRAVEA